MMFLYVSVSAEGARDSAVGWGTMLRAKSLGLDSVDFFNWPNPSSRTMGLGLLSL
jgi:hypothetical protein